MDAAGQSLIDRIWAAIEAKDWKTALSLLQDGISVMPDSLYLFQLYADILIDELQDMEAACLMLRKFVRLAIEKDSKDWLLGAMHQLFDSSHDYSRFPFGERLSMGKALSEHMLTLCQWENAHSRAEYYQAMAYFFHEVGNNIVAVELFEMTVTLVKGLPIQDEVKRLARLQKTLAEYKCHEAVRAELLC
ncbi:hypothetical protein HFN65_25045 [Rhizobium laguerreae]|uniref:hypothetical protein n=1 Tax=Rhizobium laguerreae TaxID=1076926 RepID=UPI00143F5281|nr:hypothetical protein [Rhizobium laguerreae]MBY3143208.1 hypothetical protein [Rhizobium laguerreae]MBY3252457.1 hypothetical protein [Rhizobium laguerreae]MBY3279966.1 hypothetical protein [Rhizobium laguerreae]MBY3294400.1 hypothetical protein [Rhizobium laguerreae]MBY3327271.1 hypothetical protein [Rhizobium laguerreae]